MGRDTHPTQKRDLGPLQASAGFGTIQNRLVAPNWARTTASGHQKNIRIFCGSEGSHTGCGGGIWGQFWRKNRRFWGVFENNFSVCLVGVVVPAQNWLVKRVCGVSRRKSEWKGPKTTSQPKNMPKSDPVKDHETQPESSPNQHSPKLC